MGAAQPQISSYLAVGTAAMLSPAVGVVIGTSLVSASEPPSPSESCAVAAPSGCPSRSAGAAAASDRAWVPSQASSASAVAAALAAPPALRQPPGAPGHAVPGSGGSHRCRADGARHC